MRRERNTCALARQWKARNVDDIVEKAHCHPRGLPQRRVIDVCRRQERIDDELREVERAEIAGAIGRQGFLRAGVGRAQGLAVGEVVGRIDAVDEQQPRLCAIKGTRADSCPQFARTNTPDDAAFCGFPGAGPEPLDVLSRIAFSKRVIGEDQRPCRIGLHGAHEVVGYQDRKVESGQRIRLALRIDELFDIRKVAAQRGHHGAAACAGGEDGGAHGIPDPHEGDRTGGDHASPAGGTAARAQGRKVVADSAALLHRLRAFLESLEDALHRILDHTHDKAAEESHPARRLRLRGCVRRAGSGSRAGWRGISRATRPHRARRQRLRLPPGSSCPRSALPAALRPGPGSDSPI